MKIDRHSRCRFSSACMAVVKLGLGWSPDRSVGPSSRPAVRSVDHDWTREIRCAAFAGILAFSLFVDLSLTFAQVASPAIEEAPAAVSQPKAVALLHHTIDRLASGPAFNAKVRQRVWAVGREVVGIGTYEQAGYGSGRFNLQLTMLDGAGKHSLQQISDGRLAWTRTVIADQVSLRRVDVGRLDEWIPAESQLAGFQKDRLQPIGIQPIGSVSSRRLNSQPNSSPADQGISSQVSPRLIVGAWTELLDTVLRDHTLRLGSSTIEGKPVLVVTGTLRASVRGKVMDEAGDQWPAMYPTTVKIAITTVPDQETGFGEGLPVRFEFWSDPEKRPDDSLRPRLVTLIELFAIHPMTAPPVQRFRFENQDAEVNFVNETDRYLKRYGVRITDSQRRLLWR